MKIALLSIDNRENLRRYDEIEPLIPPPQEALMQGFAALPGTEVHLICCVQQPVKSPPQLGPNLFYHSLLVPKAGWLRTGYQGCIRATRKKLRELQPDIVHGQGTERDSALCAAFSGFPNVVTIHGNMNAVARQLGARPFSFHWLTARLETLALRRTDGVFCNSSYTESLVAPRAQKTWRVPNPLRAPFFAPPPVRSCPAKPVLLNIGTVLPYKQQVKLLAVAERLQQRGLSFEIQFAGNRAAHSDYGAEFARALAAAEKAGYARHLGMLSTTELIAAMDAATALVHFSTEESFGLVVAEALTRNLKFFGAAIGGVVDIATDVEGVELFAADAFSELENALARWLTDGCRQPTRAADIMRQRYHPEVVARQHLEIYREVVGCKKTDRC